MPLPGQYWLPRAETHTRYVPRIKAPCVVSARTSFQRLEFSQKTEQPARNRQGVESYEERKSETDDLLTSPEANRDTELLGTEVGVADAMRFQGAAPELINSRYILAFGKYLTRAVCVTLACRLLVESSAHFC